MFRAREIAEERLATVEISQEELSTAHEIALLLKWKGQSAIA